MDGRQQRSIPRKRVAPGKRTAPARQRAKRSSTPRTLFWFLYKVLVVLSILIIAFFSAFQIWVAPPDQAPANRDLPNQSTPTSPVESSSAQPSVSDPVIDEDVLSRRDGVYTILLAATDADGFRTDTMMVFTYDVPNQKVGVVSVPRDTLTRRGQGKNPKLVYGVGGVEARREDISAMLGIPIDYYIQVNIRGFVALVDYLGGVEFYVPCNMDYDDPYQNLSIHFKEGQQHLNGQEAMEVARFRKNNGGSGYSDVGRTQTQQKLLIALAKKVLSWNNLTKVNGFVEIFNEYVKTDLELNDMLWFASQAIYLDPSSDVETATLAGRGDSTYRGYTYCYELDRTQTLDTINRLINPFDRDMTLEDMDLIKADGYMNLG